MDIFNWDVHHVFSFLLTFLRISLVMFLMPFFGGESLPKSIKAAFCLVFSLALWPHLSFDGAQLPSHPLQIVLMLLGELVLGLVLSLVVHFVFAAIQTGGQIIGFQMGFVMVSVVDPLTGISEAVTAHFLYMVSLLVFLSLNGHLFLFQALGKSFALVPPGGLLITQALANNIMGLSAQMFILAVKIAAPIMAVMFLVELALALISRPRPRCTS